MLRFALFVALCVKLGSCWTIVNSLTGVPDLELVDSPCQLPPSGKYEVSRLVIPNQFECEIRMGCWDQTRGLCVLPRRDGENSCATISNQDREQCNAANELQCVAKGCCWDGSQSSPSLRCFQRHITSACDEIPSALAVSCPTAYRSSCGVSGCCNTPSGGCFLPQNCDPDTFYVTRCFKGCGVGVRLVFNACWRLVAIIFCCVEPCPASGGGAPGKLCVDYQPYKTTHAALGGK